MSKIAPHTYKRVPVLTDLLRQHIPLETGEIFHRPDVVPPPSALLATDRLPVQHLSYSSRNTFVEEFDPALRVMRLFRRCVFPP